MKCNLRNILCITVLLCLAFSAQAEVVKLRSGALIRGIIIFQNEEVVVLKDASGARFQYLMSDVEAVLDDEKEEAEMPLETPKTTKKVTVGLLLSGGIAALPHYAAGGNFGADLTVGTANLLNRKIFLGGSVGYHMQSLMGTTYSFLPIQLRAGMPFMEGKNAPTASAAIGYGISANKGVKGGLAADIDFGWRHEMTQGRALFLGVYGHFQMAELTLKETINSAEYIGIQNRTFCGVGARLAIYL